MTPGPNHSYSASSSSATIGNTTPDVFSAGTLIQMAGHVGVSEVDQQLADRQNFFTDPNIVYVDLFDAIEFDVVALVLLLSAAASRRSTGREIKFRLPRDPLARHILRLWRFPKAATAVTGVPFRMLVEPGDLKYFGEKWPRFKSGREAAGPSASVLKYLVEQQQFGLSAHRIRSEYNLTRMIDNEVSRWRNYAFVKLLDKMLSGQAIDVARVVLQELLANVAEHPRSSLVIVASQLDLVAHTDEDVPAALTVSVWDDGLSIIETLRARIWAGGTIRVRTSEPVDKFIVESTGWSPKSTRYSSDWTPDSTAQDPEILLASLFPGITRKAAAPDSTSIIEVPTNPGDSGFGLFTLYKTVLDQFRGSLDVRCGHASLHLTHLDGHEAYHVRLKSDLDHQSLPGTIITARLPIHDA